MLVIFDTFLFETQKLLRNGFLSVLRGISAADDLLYPDVCSKRYMTFLAIIFFDLFMPNWDQKSVFFVLFTKNKQRCL